MTLLTAAAQGLRDRLRAFYVGQEMPPGRTGKISRRQLRELAASGASQLLACRRE